MPTVTTTVKTTRKPIGAKATRTGRKAGWRLATGMGFVLLAGIGCDHQTNRYAPPPPADVTISHPVRRTVTRYLDATGTTEAFETVELRARVPGFLDAVNFKPGAPVKRGDLLFVIDKRTYQATADRAQAELKSAEARLIEAQFEYERQQRLQKQQSATELEIIQAKVALDRAQAAIESAQAALDTAKLDLEFCEVRAPIDGRITKNLVDVGNLVGAAGQPTILAVIVNARPIYVSFDASESDVLEIRRARMASSPGAEPGEVAPGVWRPIDLALSDETEFRTHGHIDYVDPALNARSGTLRIRCRFENEDEHLVPGLFARLRIFQDQVEATLVPDIALLSDQSGRFALVVNDKNVVEVRRVQIGALDGTLRVVLAGLQLTDRVIVNGLQRARPGATVKPALEELAKKPGPSSGNAPPASGPAVPPIGEASSQPASQTGASRREGA